MGKYYDGSKLDALLDLDGDIPEIFMTVGNRTGGKTFYRKKFTLMDNFFNNGEQFVVLYRFGYEISNSCEAFVADVQDMAYQDIEFSTGSGVQNCYREWLADGKVMGYAIALSSADTLKKYSSIFSHVQRIFFDEFQSETNHYVPHEIDRLQSVHRTIARGYNKKIRYVPLYMCSNRVTDLNPYYRAFGITKRLKKETHFMRGNGWVLEIFFNSESAESATKSAFSKAFSESSYQKYSTLNKALENDEFLIKKVSENVQYRLTVFVENGGFGVLRGNEAYYITDKIDKNCKKKVTIVEQYHDDKTPLLKLNESPLNILIERFRICKLYFINSTAKAEFLKLFDA